MTGRPRAMLTDGSVEGDVAVAVGVGLTGVAPEVPDREGGAALAVVDARSADIRRDDVAERRTALAL
ncbi:MAG: hypothetical protein M3Q27_09700 [Actinomycetota bacterium]|nr:hypothetical protein [Actinomycetota bacterium]